MIIEQTFHVSHDGKPVEGATVDARPDDDSDVFSLMTTDKHGNVTMELDTGTYTVEVLSKGMRASPRLIVGTHANPFPIPLESVEKK
jgi:hypothetical protein